MGNVLLTGCTGFVGSALAATLLGAGYRVLAVSRQDPDGQRTRASVAEAAIGLGHPLDAAQLHRLTVIEADAQNLEAQLTPERLADVGAAWHAAAEMSYAPQKALASYQTNVVTTLRLYRHLAAHAPQCRRFFYISTAYTAGMEGGEVEEVLHSGRPYDNVYQLTKGHAEHSLAHAQRTAGLPVTLFRPTIVVGHTATGWARRNGFGFHMFIEAIASVGRAGIASVRFDLDPQARPDLIPVDRLARDALALTARAREGLPLEVLHGAGGLGETLQGVLTTIGRVCDVDVRFGALQSPVDRRIDRAIEPNRRFASTEWRFSTRRLQAALGGVARAPVEAAQLGRMVHWYLADGEAPRRGRRPLRVEAPAAPAVDAWAEPLLAPQTL